LSDLWAPELAGRVEVLSEMRDTIGLIMLDQGVDPAGKWGSDQFDAAVAVLKAKISSGHIRQVRGITSNARSSTCSTSPPAPTRPNPDTPQPHEPGGPNHPPEVRNVSQYVARQRNPLFSSSSTRDARADAVPRATTDPQRVPRIAGDDGLLGRAHGSPSDLIGAVVAYFVGVLVVFVGVLVSIALHEIGHMVPAKRFGVRVSHYFVGFGPTLWSRTRGETEYGIKAIPLGGYVRIVGMYPTDAAVGSPQPRTVLGRIAAQARELSAEEIPPGQDHRAFYRLSAPKKLVVMLGGPIMNLVIATVLLGVVLVGFGVPSSSTTVDTVSQCVLPATATATTCSASDPVAPAAAAGLLPGDRIVSYDGHAVTSWDQLSGLIRGTGATQVPVVLERAGKTVTTSVSPIVADRPVYAPDGTPEVAANGTPVTARVGFLGIAPATELVPQPITALPGVIGTTVWATVKVVGTLPAQVGHVAQAAFGSAPRDSTSVIGLVGVGRFAGQIASEHAVGYGFAQRVASLLSLVASLNIALFVFNLIPLLPLDGGHVAGALWEGARRQVARLRGLPRPGPFDTARLVPLAYGVFVLLAGLGVLLIYADIIKPATLG
jgi:membrane-associated protease RseP (regulator of RpoE activity)